MKRKRSFVFVFDEFQPEKKIRKLDASTYFSSHKGKEFHTFNVKERRFEKKTSDGVLSEDDSFPRVVFHESDEENEKKMSFAEREKEFVYFSYFHQNEYSILAPPTTPLQESKKVPFSSINKESDVKRVFGCISDAYKGKWKIPFPDKFDDIDEESKELMKEFLGLERVLRGVNEAADSQYISSVVRKSAVIARKSSKREFNVSLEVKHSGKEATGNFDFEIYENGKEDICLVVVEAKRTGEYEKGVPQLLMELKAVQEEEEKREEMDKDQWYYGFAATRDLWTPCRVNMHKPKGKQVQIASKIAINIHTLATFQQILFALKGCILKEFDKEVSETTM